MIEFAYDLDYEKYMEDFEVRQAFEIIKDRISEIKADQDWKEKIADEWNKTAELEAQQAAQEAPKADQGEMRSVYSYSKYTLSQLFIKESSGPFSASLNSSSLELPFDILYYTI